MMTFETRPPLARSADSALGGLPLSGQFLLWGAVGLFGVLALAVSTTEGMAGPPAAAAVYALAIGLTARALRGYPHLRLGACNLVTLIRLVLVSALIALLVAQDAAAWVVFVIASLALALDGVDGWLARRAGLVSEFGARFDMEVDALLALTLACQAIASGAAGPLILALGLPRYVFWAAGAVWPWLMQDLPDRFSRKAICVVQIGVLIAVLVPGMPRGAADAMAVLAALLVAWSFWVDIRWLRTRHK